ncbi:MAG: ABC transporter permease [Acidimicrobiia bacterium]|nr:ABC transporter permease [Acidimicrobiia bacterium]
MIDDLRTVMWKERKSLFRQPGSRLRMLLTVAVPIVYFGIVGPLQAGETFATGPDPWFIATVLPLLTVIMIAPDSFAGERERKTLRTLLASRLPDSAILWAKVGFSILLATGMMTFTLLVAVVVANIFIDTGGLVLIESGRLAYMFAVSLLLSTTTAGAAVLISLRAQTVQQAQQMLAATFFLVPTVLGPIVLLFSDEDFRPIEAIFKRLGTPAGRFGLILGLTILACLLLTLARRSFQRNKLTS